MGSRIECGVYATVWHKQKQVDMIRCYDCL